MAATLGAFLVQSRLDYANSIMYGMSVSNVYKLQSAQNSLTHVVLPSLYHLLSIERLSYFPVNYQIQFKIATLSDKTLVTCQPSYLDNLPKYWYTSRHELSALPTSSFSNYHAYQLYFGQLAFSYSSPAVWNCIPTSLKNCSSLYSFKHHIKSHLIFQHNISY